VCILNDDAARLYKNDRMPPPNIKFKHKLTRTFAANFRNLSLRQDFM